MRGPNSIQKCHILQASQALVGHYFSLGFHPLLYTVLYTDGSAFLSQQNQRFGKPRRCTTRENRFLNWRIGIGISVFPMSGDSAGRLVEPVPVLRKSRNFHGAKKLVAVGSGSP